MAYSIHDPGYQDALVEFINTNTPYDANEILSDDAEYDPATRTLHLSVIPHNEDGSITYPPNGDLASITKRVTYQLPEDAPLPERFYL